MTLGSLDIMQDPLTKAKMISSAWDFQQCGMCDQQSLRPACAYAQSDQSLCYSLEYSMNVTLLTEHHLESLSLTGGCRGSSESTLVKMPFCWNHVSWLFGRYHTMSNIMRSGSICRALD